MLFWVVTFLPQKTFRKIVIFLRRDRVQKKSRWNNFEKKIAAIDSWRPTLQCFYCSEIRSSLTKNSKSTITESHFFVNIAALISDWCSFWWNRVDTKYNWGKKMQMWQKTTQTHILHALECSQCIQNVAEAVAACMEQISKIIADTKIPGKS